ncbi:hypothetical protein J8273_0023 [Carpediemonas membranifera]|uniref:Uncharacterized protein n=1 Tax=Carpediemonas membranifera TaxID=201153 RepID=A0A8J6BYS5_9EUKA|nr:hypothetical protein J8273_0023 [Carpediemonas membranifera]|eukprot:KAG9394821.1 hypothetical protein J8273_0023 [Carpediemonas membranifera]
MSTSINTVTGNYPTIKLNDATIESIDAFERMGRIFLATNSKVAPTDFLSLEDITELQAQYPDVDFTRATLDQLSTLMRKLVTPDNVIDLLDNLASLSLNWDSTRNVPNGTAMGSIERATRVLVASFRNRMRLFDSLPPGEDLPEAATDEEVSSRRHRFEQLCSRLLIDALQRPKALKTKTTRGRFPRYLGRVSPRRRV